MEELYKRQEKLDNMIIKKHKLEGQSNQKRYIRTILALGVELYELCNATKCFKDWSIQSANQELILEESADCLHFILSLGNQLGFHDFRFDTLDFMRERDLESQFIRTQGVISKLESYEIDSDKNNILFHYAKINRMFIAIMEKLNITEVELKYAYREKWLKNIKRQKNNY